MAVTTATRENANRTRPTRLDGRAAADFPIAAADRSVDRSDQPELVADARHDAEMIDTFGFKTLLGAHAPSLPNIPQLRYFGVRNVG